MYKGKKVSVIIAGAGFGKRMNCNIPKQFMKLNDMPILAVTISAFQTNKYVNEIVLVTNADFMEFAKSEIVNKYNFSKVVNIVEGGKERQDSINKALNVISDDSFLILIHDGARPYVSQDVINDSIERSFDKGGAVAAVPSKDTIKILEGDIFVETPDRNKLYNIQTPQGFHKELILKAYSEAYKDNFYGTDDAMLVERIGEKVYLSMGEYKNIKITTPDDLPKELGTPRIGTGYDVHALIEGRDLILGGVNIPFDRGLLGHSDADVLLHALMDAMLGAAALGDIGRHFPDKDPKYKGISSLELLRETGKLIRERGYTIGNLDVTLIAEKPKVAQYIEDMRKNISYTLGISIDNINVKATTTEKLGFCGREEGIASEAIALLMPLV